MTPNQLTAKIKRAEAYIKKNAPRVAGIEAVNHFKQSFQNEGFTDSHLEKWKQPKRTVTNSPWYGFRYGARTKLPSNHPRRRKAKGKYKARKANPITNYSPAATRKKTLSGATGDLKDSISYTVQPGRVIVESDQPYARVHNEGGTIKVFGRKTVKVPKRQFIGDSLKLRAKIRHEIQKDLKRILS